MYNFISPLTTLSLMVLGSSFFMSFISLYLTEINLGRFQIGLIQSSFYLGLLISSLLSEKLISRVGHIRSLTATSGILGASTLILLVIPPSSWFWFRLIAGACVGSFYVGVESWILAESEPSKRGFALSLYTMSIYLAQSLSQLFLSSVHNNPSSAYILSAFFICLAVVPISISTKLGPKVSVSEPESLLKFFKLSPLGTFGCFASGIILSTLYTNMPVYFDIKGLNPGHQMTTLILGGAFLQWPIGKISDSFDRRDVLAFLSIAGSLIALSTLFVQSPIPFGIMIFVLGGFLFTIYPVAMALGCDCVEQNDLVKMTGVLLFAYALGAVIGPVLTPALEIFGENSIAFSLAVYCSLLLAVALYAKKTMKTIDPEEQSPFTAIPTGPIVETLHPNQINSEEGLSSQEEKQKKEEPKD